MKRVLAIMVALNMVLSFAFLLADEFESSMFHMGAAIVFSVIGGYDRH